MINSNNVADGGVISRNSSDWGIFYPDVSLAALCAVSTAVTSLLLEELEVEVYSQVCPTPMLPINWE